MDHVGQFGQDVAAFEAAGREAASSPAAPAVPSWRGWVMIDLVLHLGLVHRLVARVIAKRMQQPPSEGDRSWLGLPGLWRDWLPPGRAPRQSPLPAGLLDWFQAGATELRELFRAADPGERVWTWSADHSVGFWQRMQAIEAAVHRWDAQTAVRAAQPIDAALAADAIAQTFEVMAPMRRALAKAPPGQGERFVFRRTDGPQTWAVRFDADAVLLGAPQGSYDIQISGTASDLALFLWQRDLTGHLEVQGDSSLPNRYFALVPPSWATTPGTRAKRPTVPPMQIDRFGVVSQLPCRTSASAPNGGSTHRTGARHHHVR